MITFLSACSKLPLPEEGTTKFVHAKENPQEFISELHYLGQGLNSWNDLKPSIQKNLKYVERKPQHKFAINRKGLKLTWGQMAATLRELDALLPELDANQDLFLQKFKWISIDQGMLYSGYYEPTLEVSRSRQGKYVYPLYKKPPDLNSYLKRGKSYHSRKAIDGDKILQGRGLELVWAADYLDVYYLQIQGSGRLVFEDGSYVYANYHAQNRHEYVSSARIMREAGLLEKGFIYEQRDWFKRNPHRINEILFQNPSYVFFRLGMDGAIGAMGVVVDPWLSLATDRKFIPLGAIVLYGVNIPDQLRGQVPLRGIGFAQDVGGAIKNNRIDIFCGGSNKADYVASHLDQKGIAWILLSKNQ